jgi:hypothetical protein
MPALMPTAARRPFLALFIAYCSPAMPICRIDDVATLDGFNSPAK